MCQCWSTNINIWAPWNFCKWKLWHARTLKIWIWTSKVIPDLWLVDLFWPIKKIPHSTLIAQDVMPFSDFDFVSPPNSDDRNCFAKLQYLFSVESALSGELCRGQRWVQLNGIPRIKYASMLYVDTTHNTFFQFLQYNKALYTVLPFNNF